MEWDLCSSTFRILFSMGTNKVPPPEPKTPLINPVKEPIKQFLKLKEDARIAKQEIRKYVSDSAKLKEQIDKAKNLEEEYSNHPLIINEKVYKEELLELIDPLFDMLK